MVPVFTLEACRWLPALWSERRASVTCVWAYDTYMIWVHYIWYEWVYEMYVYYMYDMGILYMMYDMSILHMWYDMYVMSILHMICDMSIWDVWYEWVYYLWYVIYEYMIYDMYSVWYEYVTYDMSNTHWVYYGMIWVTGHRGLTRNYRYHHLIPLTPCHLYSPNHDDEVPGKGDKKRHLSGVRIAMIIRLRRCTQETFGFQKIFSRKPLFGCLENFCATKSSFNL